MTTPLTAVASPLTRRKWLRHGRRAITAANDNALPGHSAELRAALKHFAEHGLGAAAVARGHAERAFFSGDRQAYQHWLTICRTLDRRMAGALAAQIDAGND